MVLFCLFFLAYIFFVDCACFEVECMIVDSRFCSFAEAWWCSSVHEVSPSWSWRWYDLEPKKTANMELYFLYFSILFIIRLTIFARTVDSYIFWAIDCIYKIFIICLTACRTSRKVLWCWLSHLFAWKSHEQV